MATRSRREEGPCKGEGLERWVRVTLASGVVDECVRSEQSSCKIRKLIEVEATGEGRQLQMEPVMDQWTYLLQDVHNLFQCLSFGESI